MIPVLITLVIVAVLVSAALIFESQMDECPRVELGYNCKGKNCQHIKK